VNALMSHSDIKRYCVLKREDAQWLEQVLNQLGLSVRAWQRILKVARTIADLSGEKEMSREHLTEAVSYRGIERMLIYLQKNLE